MPEKPVDVGEPAIYRGPRDSRAVALTFDDGPDARFTPAILDVLRRERVRATFFLVGQRAEAHPDVVQRIVAEGHVIGNHSWNHPRLVRLSPDEIRDQLARTDAVLRRLSGRPVRYFRPPYGLFNPAVAAAAREFGYHTVMWSVDSLDWKSLSAAQVSRNDLARLRSGDIILHHSAGGTGENLTGTVRALPVVIAAVRRHGWRLVTVPELLGERLP